MTIYEIQQYCLSKPGVTEYFPFDEDTPCYKAGKIFLLANLIPPLSINLKCDPEKAVELREKYEEVIPGYHMNKRHWNTVYLESNIPKKEILEWIDHSYDLIVASLSRKERIEVFGEKCT